MYFFLFLPGYPRILLKNETSPVWGFVTITPNKYASWNRIYIITLTII